MLQNDLQGKKKGKTSWDSRSSSGCQNDGVSKQVHVPFGFWFMSYTCNYFSPLSYILKDTVYVKLKDKNT